MPNMFSYHVKDENTPFFHNFIFQHYSEHQKIINLYNIIKNRVLNHKHNCPEKNFF